ncbi:MAG: hypothetical protein ACI4CC_01545 [Lachnospiraceae bacterium]
MKNLNTWLPSGKRYSTEWYHPETNEFYAPAGKSYLISEHLRNAEIKLTRCELEKEQGQKFLREMRKAIKHFDQTAPEQSLRILTYSVQRNAGDKTGDTLLEAYRCSDLKNNRDLMSYTLLDRQNPYGFEIPQNTIIMPGANGKIADMKPEDYKEFGYKTTLLDAQYFWNPNTRRRVLLYCRHLKAYTMIRSAWDGKPVFKTVFIQEEY